MMPDLGKYAASVLSAYGVSLVLLAALVLLTLRRGAAARRGLDAIDSKKQRDDA
jgi:heme exporter protein D